MKRILLASLITLVFTGCGYRAPLYQSYIPEVNDTTEYPGVRPDYQELAALMEKDTGFMPTEGNTVTLLPEGPRKWDLLKEDLEYAEKSVYIDHYRFRADSAGSIVEGILKEKAREGADVRVILDKPANTKEDRAELATMREDGVKLDFFRHPVMLIDHVWPSMGTHRDHRKILILDGQTGYVGGRNIQDEYFFDWRDADIRITGPAIADLSAIYMENQERVAPHRGPVHVAEDLEKAARMDNVPEMEQFTDVTVQFISDSPTDKVLPLRNCFEWALYSAKKYFWFYNPYTPPPASTLQALKDAAARGVDVRWIVPAINDVTPAKWMGESMYKELLAAGVRIYEWQDHVLHAKQFMTDDYLLIIGSSNMDNLSFFLNYEVVALVYDEATTRHAAETFLADTEKNCVEITLEEVKNWNVFRKLRNWLTRHLGGPMG
jgi:cardiolipin synthase